MAKTVTLKLTENEHKALIIYLEDAEKRCEDAMAYNRPPPTMLSHYVTKIEAIRKLRAKVKKVA